jgi:subtilisin family serine protease/PKD repeat protein
MNFLTLFKNDFFFLSVLLFYISSQNGFCQPGKPISLPENLQPGTYQPGVIVIKLKDAQNTRRLSATPSLRTITAEVKASNVQKIFPHHPTTSRVARVTGKEYAVLYDTDLSRIYKLNIDSNSNIPEVIKQLLQHSAIEYAEPYYLMEPLAYTPNDPQANNTTGAQKYLATIKAYDAWEIEKGDTSIVIGILDTGVGLGHEDLDNLHYNRKDPINGADDDGDGYIDNFLGWDMANNDNDPDADKDTHGTAVTGMAAATTDNGIGMAGTGFRSRYMPIKIFKSEDNSFGNGYEAIVYAADQGCKVINLSWGSASGYSQLAQDVINYAVLEKDAVVVAAAGNSGKFEYYYPASYDNVLSVTNSDISDKKNADGTYNYLVDLIAPGTNVFSTKNDDQYLTTSGTSFSTPLVAGAAALIRAKYPELTATQVMERVRLSADNIYTMGSNGDFPEQLGYGRLNMAKALQPLNVPALRMLRFSYYNGIGKYAMGGDTLSISIDITNYLMQSSVAASVTLSTLSPYVTLLDSVLQVQSLDTFAVFSSQIHPFRVVLHEDLPLGEELVFRLGFSDKTYNYHDYQYFWIDASSDYLDLNIAEAQLTISSNGALGFNPEINNEAGFTYKNTRLTNEMGLIVAAGKDSVSDNAIISFSEGDRSTDFAKLISLQLNKEETVDIKASSAFSDSEATNPMNLRIEQAILGDEGENYFIVQYRVINTGDSALSNVHPALFSDWNLNDPKKNKAGWDNAHQLGYAYDAAENNLYAGIALLTTQMPAYYAIDKDSLYGNAIDISGDFTDSIKYEFLKNGIAKTEAGTLGAGNDVAHLLGATIDSLPKNAAVQMAFAIMGGESLQELQQTVNKAKAAYTDYLKHPSLLSTIKICSDSTVTLTPEEGENFRFYQDPLMATLLHEGDSFTTGAISTDSAIYITNIDAGFESTIRRVDIEVLTPEAKFSVMAGANSGFVNDTLFLDETGNFILPLQDESIHAVQWKWNFDNGYASTLQHPKPRFTETGNYTISLTAISEPGCKHNFTKNITVVHRSPRPILPDVSLCEGETATLAASNATQLRIFADETLKTLIAAGNNYTIGPFAADTTFFVVNTDSVYQSLPEKVDVIVDQAGFDFSANIDTLNLESKYLLELKGTGNLSTDRAYTWLVNEDSVGQSPKLIYDYSSHLNENAASFEISLKVSTSKGCVYTAGHSYKIKPSPLPVLTLEKSCPGSNVQMAPSGGKVFCFYADADLQDLLHKGSDFTFENLYTDTIIYITNIDSLQESSVLATPIYVDNFADFTLSADTIRLNETDTVVFTAFTTDPEESRNIIWRWDFGNDNTADVPVVVQKFDTTGVYTIQLTAEAGGACTNIIEKKLSVENVSSVQAPGIIEKGTRLYPNPTQGTFTIENLHWRYKNLQVTLTTLQGQILWNTEVYYRTLPVTLDMEQQMGRKLLTGTYLIHITSENYQITRKLIINP